MSTNNIPLYQLIEIYDPTNEMHQGDTWIGDWNPTKKKKYGIPEVVTKKNIGPGGIKKVVFNPRERCVLLWVVDVHLIDTNTRQVVKETGTKTVKVIHGETRQPFVKFAASNTFNGNQYKKFYGKFSPDLKSYKAWSAWLIARYCEKSQKIVSGTIIVNDMLKIPMKFENVKYHGFQEVTKKNLNFMKVLRNAHAHLQKKGDLPKEISDMGDALFKGHALFVLYDPKVYKEAGFSKAHKVRIDDKDEDWNDDEIVITSKYYHLQNFEKECQRKKKKGAKYEPKVSTILLPHEIYYYTHSYNSASDKGKTWMTNWQCPRINAVSSEAMEETIHNLKRDPDIRSSSPQNVMHGYPAKYVSFALNLSANFVC